MACIPCFAIHPSTTFSHRVFVVGWVGSSAAAIGREREPRIRRAKETERQRANVGLRENGRITFSHREESDLRTLCRGLFDGTLRGGWRDVRCVLPGDGVRVVAYVVVGVR